ncbi:nitrous oxide reductase accessory protein NosL [Lysinibacillus endophyticus]|uniref:nitrous oxide reductase accessory protein NosL n=1 Tax=Ureibacillus endophyticus TaxID=1978490 RepID=UPI00209FD11A|nr:nitrous oxide reductase accessory protein NosL [Lysinibacillus endophyticus]MCP1144849.1 nitrous oxide reductase accessory protein NosL [Lysinibacillus endophyticus]
MKLWKWLCLLLFVFLLTACGDKAYKPREINPETDVCHICNMSVTSIDYAAQVVLKNNDIVVFDDLGCLMEYIKQNGEQEIGAAYIRDMNSSNWLDIKDASYVYSADYWTPMNYGVLAFASEQEAKEYMKENPGKIVPYENLLTFNWGVHEHE